ncbi:MAG: NADPH-dependent assimilatory sulfite reductase hemoprotein subunit [Thermodesulfobacteriales bacterium]|nr:MAG: NADPH-dependent assimilatory sulfite reductase hemoprotein subunit [Thermodesulfobacteriales bacterium]
MYARYPVSMSKDLKKSKVEIIKEQSNGLRGAIKSELESDSDQFSNEEYELLKFHGIYQQDDRDVRQQLKKEGKGKKYIFMIRTKNPGGGEITPEQWEVLNEVSDRYADGTLRITTREDIQFHGVGKQNLKAAIQHLNSELVCTNGACGDVNRNTVASPVADIMKGSIFDAQAWAKKISDHLSYKTNSYFDVWLDGEKLNLNKSETETIYGNAYLPRKFKIGIALPDDNSLDVHTHDIGIIPKLTDKLEGFNILIGGGLGSHHRQKHTFPRLSDPLAFVPPEKLIEVVTKIVEFQRDNGNRSDRKQARFKYVVDKWGVNKVREELEKRLGYKLDKQKDIEIKEIQNHLGWHEQNMPGLWYVGIFVENGRIKDTDKSQMKTGLLEIVKKFRTGVRLTPLQDIILAGIPEDKIEEIKSEFAKYEIKSEEEYSALRLNSMACPALPTCGLALAESERFLPYLIDELEQRGYGNEAITIRMSGCPNACSRPPVAEIGIMGTSPGKHNIYLGGNHLGTRLNKLYDELVSEDDLADRIAEFIETYHENKMNDERFGDFCHRIGLDQIRELTGKISVRNQSPG